MAYTMIPKIIVIRINAGKNHLENGHSVKYVPIDQ